ncbi:MAG: methyltransferase domain-containing protein [Candidatus Sungbacteria bacterium]|nr:methyltransferase domain-containing protein [Candidatus Sungbacteria bacterium]
MPLETLAVLSGEGGKKKVRIGYCSRCGYVGYRDRPDEAWIAEFYSSVWDRAGDGKKQKSDRRIARVKRGDLGRKNDTVRMIETVTSDRNRQVLEIGCGYGESLGFLKRAGFARLMGIEYSPRRAEIAAQISGSEVLTGSFESPDVRTVLAQSAPFGIIFSHHTLEHVYDPAVFVEHAAHLQGEGDYLVLSVPNVLGESSMTILTFLPHLHSFSPMAFDRLLARFGYKIKDRSFTSDRVLNVIAQKTAYIPPPAPAAAPGVIASALREKIAGGLGLDRPQRSGVRRLWWYKKADIGGQMAFFGNTLLEAAHYALASRVINRRFKDNVPDQSMLSFLIADYDQSVASGERTMFEIEFDGPITLLYK